MNDATAPGTWAAVPDAAYPGGIESTNAIKVGIIYQPAVVAPLGPPVADPDPVFAEDRPPVAQTFVADGEVFTVMVNHFKSKGCTGRSRRRPDQNDGQACYNERRTNQAAAVLDFVEALQAATGDDDVLVIGDLNSYLAEDPITELETGLDNLVDAYIDPTDQYSFVFFGMAGMLDYAFSTEALTSKVTGTAVWHINADEPRVLDYNDDIVDPGERSSEFMQELFDPNIVYRSSDHDPVIVGLELGSTTAEDLKGRRTRGCRPAPDGDSKVDKDLRFAKSRIWQSLRGGTGRTPTPCATTARRCSPTSTTQLASSTRSRPVRVDGHRRRSSRIQAGCGRLPVGSLRAGAGDCRLRQVREDRRSRRRLRQRRGCNGCR